MAAAAVFGERLGLAQWIGSVIVVVAVAALTIQLARNQAAPQPAIYPEAAAE